MKGDVARRARGQRKGFGPERVDDFVDDVEHRLRRSEARSDREVAELGRILRLGKLARSALEMLPRRPESLRVGALEAVDRLLEVADHEERPAPLLGLARAAEIFLDQLLDDFPLRRISVLRLVDQDMVDLPTELVADPVADAGLP